jgi:hypothetical protein
MSVGSAIAWFAPWLPIRIVGLVFAALGFGAGTTWVVRRFVLGSVVRVWRYLQRRRVSRRLDPFAA